MKKDQRFVLILKTAARVFADLGYHRASVRDISRETKLSLAGLYYYFGSKEDLLHLIQRHCFETLLERLEEGLGRLREPEERIRFLVATHVGYFTENIDEMKVMSHEGRSLTGKHRREVREYKRAYYLLVTGVVKGLLRKRRIRGVRVRSAVMALFGMMNWIYTWYRPAKDGSARRLADTLARIYLDGLRPRRVPSSKFQVPSAR